MDASLGYLVQGLYFLIIFVGLHNNGFLTFNPTNTLDSKYYPLSTPVNGFSSIGNGEVAVCTEREGLMIYKGGEIIGAINNTNVTWLTDKCVYTIFVDDENKISRVTNYEKHGLLKDMA